MTTKTINRQGVGRRGLMAFALCACLLAAAVGAGSAKATFGDHYGLAAGEGAVPGPYAFWAGTCDLAAAPAPGVPIAGGFGQRPLESPVTNGVPPFLPATFGPTPAVPRDCIDTSITNYATSQARAWNPAPAWRLPAVTQAGAHPDATALIALARDTANESGVGATIPAPAGSTRDVKVQLPVGFAGNPGAVPYCSQVDFEASPPQCPSASQVGVTEIRVNLLGATMIFDLVPVYNLAPTPGHTAEFGMPDLGNITALRIAANARTDSDNGVTVGVERIPTGLPLVQQSVTLWGVPWDSSHDPYRFKPGNQGLPNGSIAPIGLPPAEQASYEPGWGPIEPFISNPTTCSSQGPVTKVWLDSWQHRAATLADGEPDPADPNWVRADSESPPVTGCEKLASHFSPGLTMQPQSHVADSPSAYDADLSVPQNNDPPASVATDASGSGAPAYWRTDAGLATSHLKDTTVTLPEGVTVNPAGANGLAACSESQIGLVTTEGEAPNPIRFDNEVPSCPEASKIGTVEIETPLLAETLHGSVYIAAQEANPFHSLLALYLVVEDPARNLIVKLAGKTVTDPSTGRITATFTDNPQLPFSHVRLHLRGGASAPLANPATCGSYATNSSLTPWSGQAAVSASDSFAIDQGPGGACANSVAGQPFNLGFEAGTSNPLAGATSPFMLRITRPDGAQTIDRIDMTTPAGFSAYLAGVPYCPESALAQAAGRDKPGDGRLEEAQPSCPAASQVGTATVGAGAGPNPYYVSGNVYLAGPYKGAPLSLAFVVPAVAGPFDLGVQTVRTALYVDPETAQITAKSDPIPTILQGIPLRIRDIRVNVDRPGFTLNPTSCNPREVTATVQGAGGATVNPTNRFQVGGCSQLKFEPTLKLTLKGKTKRTGHPALKAEVTYPQQGAYANIRTAQVNLPHSEFLDQNNLNKTCTKPVLLEGKCPSSTIYGTAKAWTPLLERPLEGNVYLVGGYGYKLPALVAELNGQIRVVLKGKVDSGPNKGIRSTFEAVPDAPVSRFVLEMKGGPKYGLLINSENLCKGPQKAIARFTAQNGQVKQFNPLVANSCKKKKKSKKK